jgi:putative addiction module killer protein
MHVRRTEEFADWLSGLRDKQARAKILVRIDRLEDGNPGKTRSVGTGVVEMKIDFGPGYRVYYIQRGQTLILLLCGGDKSTQTNDIQRAKLIAAQWDESD